MSRPKKTPLERACEALAAIPAARRTALRSRVDDVRSSTRESERIDRKLAAAPGCGPAAKVALIANAQAANDAARDLRKLLALLDAIGGAS
jgi:hypothetical protein